MNKRKLGHYWTPFHLEAKDKTEAFAGSTAARDQKLSQPPIQAGEVSCFA